MANNGIPSSQGNAYYLENGRGYGSFKRGQYILPCDATERDRLDVMNTLFKTVRDRDKRLINAPFREIPPTPSGDRSRILDLGCGTGIWLLEMAEQFRETEFLGLDLNTMGPETLLPNVDIRVPIDYEGPWTLGEQAWDVIHLQMALGSISLWPPIYSKVIRHLKPGIGWFESVEIDFEPRCADGTLREGRLTQWWQNVRDCYTYIGRSIAYNPDTGEDLRRAGFKDIDHKVYRLPLNAWPSESRDRAQHRAGMWYNIAMSSGVDANGGYGMEAISLAALSRYFKWPPDHVQRLYTEALQEASDPNVHAYNELHVWSGRAPYPNEPR